MIDTCNTYIITWHGHPQLIAWLIFCFCAQMKWPPYGSLPSTDSTTFPWRIFFLLMKSKWWLLVHFNQIATVFLKRVALFPRRLVVIIERGRSTCLGMGLRRRLMILNPDQMQSLGPGGCRDGPNTKSESQEKERDQKQPVRTCSRSKFPIASQHKSCLWLPNPTLDTDQTYITGAPSSPRSKPKPIFSLPYPVLPLVWVLRAGKP